MTEEKAILDAMYMTVETIDQTGAIPSVDMFKHYVEEEYGYILSNGLALAFRDMACRKYMTDILGMEEMNND